jgi:hypothetical protein
VDGLFCLRRRVNGDVYLSIRQVNSRNIGLRIMNTFVAMLEGGGENKTRTNRGYLGRNLPAVQHGGLKTGRLSGCLTLVGTYLGTDLDM